MRTITGSAITLHVLFLLLGPLPFSLSTQAVGTPFLVGTAQVEITPPLGLAMSGWSHREHGATGIDDPLYLQAMVLSDGADTVALITADIINWPREQVLEIRRRVNLDTGIDPDHLMVSASHTHFGPDLGKKTAWLSNLPAWAAGAVRMAVDNMAPALIDAGVGAAPGLGYNRRGRAPDGSISMVWHHPPPEGHRLVGPVDNSVGVIRIDSETGHPLAVLFNFAVHPVCNEDRFYDYSADYPGVARDLIESVVGGQAFFTLGTHGDINPVARREGAKRKTGVGLGAEVVRIWASLEPSDAGKIAAANRMVKLPLKEPTAVNQHLETEVQVLRLGNNFLVGLPGEILVRIGQTIKEKAGRPNVFVTDVTNDHISYVPGREEFPIEGYEVGRSRVAPGADEILVRTALQLIQNL
ncbi:neutral/alkaline non-lysosomal ceramidase N-terminal domain-containing protein [candidate division KSB1 bacterium]